MVVFDNPDVCIRCHAKCCRYIMLQIDTPTRKIDFENLRWYLSHHGTTIYLEKGNIWFLHIDSICRHLTSDGRCGIYDNRPQICREHDPSGCEFDSEYTAKVKFSNIEELDDYIARRFSKDKKAKGVQVKASA